MRDVDASTRSGHENLTALASASGAAFRQGVAKRAKTVLARGDERPLLIERQRERPHVGVAARQGDDLRVHLTNLSKDGRRGGRRGLDAGATAAERLERPQRTRASEPAIRFSMRVITASSASAMCGACAPESRAPSRPHRRRAPRHATCRRTLRHDRLERIPERVGGLLRGAERETLRLEVRVLDREIENAAVQVAIFANRLTNSLSRPISSDYQGLEASAPAPRYPVF